MKTITTILLVILATIFSATSHAEEFGFISTVFGKKSAFNSNEISSKKADFYLQKNYLFYMGNETNEDINEVERMLNKEDSNKKEEWRLFTENRTLNENDLKICLAVFGESSEECIIAHLHVITGEPVYANTRYGHDADGFLIIASNNP